MMKIRRSAAVLLLLTLLTSSCRQMIPEPAQEQDDTAITEEQDYLETTMEKTEYQFVCKAAAEAPQRTLAEPEGHTRAVPTAASIGLSGYASDMVNGNIRNWALSALHDNPNIIEQIANCGSGMQIGSMIGDAFAQVANGLIELGIDETHGFDGGHAIRVTTKKSGVWGDIDYRIAALEGTRLDWTGAKEVWFYADASEHAKRNVRIGFAFQEKNTNADGNVTGDYESWGLKLGTYASVYNTASGSEWKDVKVQKSGSTDWNPGRIELPAGFVGWIRIPLTDEHFTAYWASASYNNTIDLRDVNQFQICVEGSAASLGSSVYLSGFAIAGDVGGGELPVAAEESVMTFAVTVPLENLTPGSGKTYSGGIMPWYDEFPGKLLTGIAFNYALSPSEELKAAGDELAEALRAAQKEDGYLGIYSMRERFGQGGNWDVWGHYHMIYGLLCWARATGNQAALDTAIRGADCMYNWFVEGGRTFHSAGDQTMNLGVSHVFAELYLETGDERYLRAAVQIVEEDWPLSGNWMNNALEGRDYYQSPLPRWEALHTVCTLGTLYEITGEAKYYTALEDIWWSIAKTDRHNTGGFTSGEAACGDPYNTGAIETCCTVAWMALSSEYLQLSRNSLAADELELSYFNGMFGSLLDGERYVTYNTPMEGAKRIPSQTDIAFQYNSGSPDFNCCQANVSRGLGELSRWAVLTDADTLYLNYYGSGALEAKTPGSQTVILTQDTAYPLNGAIRLTVDGLAAEETFTLALRIPAWACQSTVEADGNTVTAEGGCYYLLNRTWKNGDTVTLNLGMSIHTWVNEADPSKTSVYYGPILLAAEGAPQRNADALCSYRDFAKATVRLADDGKHWMTFEIESDDKTLTFYDFASVGKFSAYTTWFCLNNVPARISAIKGSSPIWCNTLLY